MLFSKYLGCLEEEMSEARSRGLIQILPGVLDLLKILSRHRDFAVGLVTGNLEKAPSQSCRMQVWMVFSILADMVPTPRTGRS